MKHATAAELWNTKLLSLELNAAAGAGAWLTEPDEPFFHILVDLYVRMHDI